MSKIFTCLETRAATLERHTQWEPPGGSGVYRRTLWFWRNFSARETPCDLLVFLDGQNLFQSVVKVKALHWGAEKRFAKYSRPLLAVGVPASVRRYPEYIGWSREPGHYSPSGQSHASFLVKILLPYIGSQYPKACVKGLVGASAGGVAALYTGWSFPGVFPNIACLSAGRHYFTELLERFPGAPASKVYLSCGDRGMDREFLSDSKKFARSLKAREKVSLRSNWHRGDHSEPVWGKRIPDILQFFLG